jgi:hypothetical protein
MPWLLDKLDCAREIELHIIPSFHMVFYVQGRFRLICLMVLRAAGFCGFCPRGNRLPVSNLSNRREPHGSVREGCAP